MAPAPLVAPMPPPARPRLAGSAAARFRVEQAQAPAAAESAAVPVPPAAPTIRVETAIAASAAPPPSPIPAAPPLLAGDSAATEVARAEPAAPPPAPPPVQTAVQAPPPSIDPASLRGATATELRDRFGTPASQSPIASGMSWHYERAACRATFVLLPELSSGALRVFSYEITPGEGAMFGPAGCLGRIAATRGGRAAGTTP